MKAHGIDTAHSIADELALLLGAAVRGRTPEAALVMAGRLLADVPGGWSPQTTVSFLRDYL